jgi:hypothetical protein
MDLRRFQRFDANQEAQITLSNHSAGPIPARLIEFSEHGVRLSVREKLPVRSQIRILWRGAQLTGQVIYCRPQGEEFVAGCEVEEVLSDSELMNRPRDPGK